MRAERDFSRIAIGNRPMLRPNFRVSPLVWAKFPPLASPAVDDRRLFHPARAARPALLFSGVPAEVFIGSPRGDRGGSLVNSVEGRSFVKPDVVVACSKRRRRREVLFAFNNTGKGSRSRRRHRNWLSSYSCRS